MSIEPYKRGGTGKLAGFDRVTDLTEAQRAEYAEVAMRIRLDGNGRTSYDKIAEAMNITPTQARVFVKEGFAAMHVRDPDTVDFLSNKQVARYESLLDSWWSRAHQDHESAEVALRIMASINAVAGLESAQRIEVKGAIAHVNYDNPKDAFMATLEALEKRQAAVEIIDEDDIEDAVIVDD